MDEYILNYQKSDAITYDIHPSWYQTCEAQTKDAVIVALRKHLYEPGEYVLAFYGFNEYLLHKKDQNFFFGQVFEKTDKVPEGVICVGFIHFDYTDDTFSAYDFKNNWPKIDCGQPLVNPNAKFLISRDKLSPSPKEFEIICKKETEHFLKKLHKSVHFPLKIECDYPDVVFEICYDFKTDAKTIADTLKIIEDYAIRYNKRHEEGIHHIAEVGKNVKFRKPNAVYIHVDFGDCELRVLASILREIDKSNLPVKEIILK